MSSAVARQSLIADRIRRIHERSLHFQVTLNLSSVLIKPIFNLKLKSFEIKTTTHSF